MDKEKLRENIDELQDKARDKYAELKKNAAEKQEQAEKYIGENPKKSVLIAAGAGALVGLVIGCAISKGKKY